MKRGIPIIIVLLVIIGGVFIFNIFKNAKPPIPEIYADNQSISATQGSYCWEGIMYAQCVDMVYSLEEIAKHPSTIVSPNEKIRITFRNEPIKDTLLVHQQYPEKNASEIKLEKGIFTAPKEKGIYVYTISANWDRGSGGFFFNIEVK